MTRKYFQSVISVYLNIIIYVLVDECKDGMGCQWIPKATCNFTWSKRHCPVKCGSCEKSRIYYIYIANYHTLDFFKRNYVS